MKIAAFTGTSVRGVTYNMKEMFLSHFKDADITEFYPDDMPTFCLGCKNCFLRGDDKCPHYNKMQPVWQSVMNADLLVFAYPVYALRAPAAIKSLLDHLCVHWLVHRPEKELFAKTAVIITNSVGAPNGSAQSDVKTSMNWMGVSRVLTCGAGLMGDILWDKMTDKHRAMLENKMKKLALRVKNPYVKHMSIKVKTLFLLGKIEHAAILKGEDQPGLDTAHYIKNGWIKEKK